ncbi:hypothetical protein P152DRAFT_471146 [Eremomyces bilateralis CBS 781.70]|uniref:Uncharacterized protein n=1 Tax=Eremomyces bilateralis CBS 781.70 TaxID=1392243 RepID=A0A6G1GCC7_9PEZI|nr:uncharacterized protein P152DRAFT_471146 [Eremomyces bilateralis CBS 781.70]KAF1815747.1 hypothetical protein P152DRAFT_471146 [Eremomyces bilateralis CBS 781.70]
MGTTANAADRPATTPLHLTFSGILPTNTAFTFSAPTLGGPLSFSAASPPTWAFRPTPKRRRISSDPYPRKKRRLRLRLCTSRLSLPFSSPPTYLVDRGSCRVAVLAKMAAAAAEKEWEAQRNWAATGKGAGIWAAGKGNAGGIGSIPATCRLGVGAVAKRHRQGGLGRFACLNRRRQKRCGELSSLATHPGLLLECRDVMDLSSAHEDEHVASPNFTADSSTISDISDSATTATTLTRISLSASEGYPFSTVSRTLNPDPTVSPNLAFSTSTLSPSPTYPNFLPPNPLSTASPLGLSNYDAFDLDDDLDTPFLPDPDTNMSGTDLWPARRTRPSSNLSSPDLAAMSPRSASALAASSPDIVGQRPRPGSPERGVPLSQTQPLSLGDAGLATTPPSSPFKSTSPQLPAVALAGAPCPGPPNPNLSSAPTPRSSGVGVNPNLRFLAELGLLDGWEELEMGAGMDPDRGEGEVMRMGWGGVV